MNSILYLWTFFLIAKPQEAITVLGIIRPALILTAVIVLQVLSTRASEFIEYVQVNKTTRRFSVMYIAMILGSVFSIHRGISAQSILLFLTNYLFLILMIFIINSFDTLKKIFYVITGIILFLSIMSLIGYINVSGRATYLGSGYDPNDIAYIIIALLPMGLYAIYTANGIYKWFLIIPFLMGLLVVAYSGSRGGFLGLLTFSILTMFISKSRNIRKYKVVFIIGIIVVYFSMNADQYTRINSLLNLKMDYNYSGEEGRLQIWGQAINLIFQNPVFGVGINCFPKAVGELRAGMDLVPVWQTVHNTFLQVAAEAGLIVFGLFLSLCIRTMKIFQRIKNIKDESSSLEKFKMAATLLQIGFISQAVSAFFLSQAYSLIFPLYFALAAIMEKIEFSFNSVSDIR